MAELGGSSVLARAQLVLVNIAVVVEDLPRVLIETLRWLIRDEGLQHELTSALAGCIDDGRL
jgi:hypothetical protein